MSRPPPRKFRLMWRDGVFVPHGHTAAYCDDEFGEGEVVTFERHEEVSQASRGHYHACIQEAWHNLPEADNRFPNPEALRKWALIKSGYCTEASVVCDSPEQAATIAAFMGFTEGVIIVVKDNVVKRFVARSQSAAAMGNKEFQKSKNDVLDTIAELVRVKTARLEEAARRTA